MPRQDWRNDDDFMIRDDRERSRGDYSDRSRDYGGYEDRDRRALFGDRAELSSRRRGME